MDGSQRPKGLNKACFLLIVISGMERYAFKGVASNLVTYLTDIVNMSNSSAAKMVNIWCGLTSILPLVLAPLADSYWDRYSTITAFSFIYVVGLVALTSTAMTLSWSPESIAGSSSFLFWSLCLISLGQAGYNPSLQAFAADQLEKEDEHHPSSKEEQSSNKKKSLFFQWWYFGICGGSLLGVTTLSYIQDTYGWVLGFAIPAIAMIASLVFFWCGSRIYTYREEEFVHFRSFRSIIRDIKAAASRIMNRKITLRNEEPDEIELEIQEKPLCLHQDGDDDIEAYQENLKLGVHTAENFRVVLRLLPIWTMMLMFAVMFQQPATFFTKQGMTMKRNIGSHFMIPPATLQSAITISIILLMPLYDKVFIPMAQFITRNEKGVSVTQRMGIGMVLSIMGLVIAAIVERKRLEVSHKVKILNPDLETVPLSIFTLLPQYILLGISDIFTVVGMQEFFYSEVPVRMKTMGLALYTSVFGVGSFLSAFLISMIELITKFQGTDSWFLDDMDKSRLDKYYWLLAILSTLSLFLYTILCQYHKPRSDQTEDEIQCTS